MQKPVLPQPKQLQGRSRIVNLAVLGPNQNQNYPFSGQVVIHDPSRDSEAVFLPVRRTPNGYIKAEDKGDFSTNIFKLKSYNKSNDSEFKHVFETLTSQAKVTSKAGTTPDDNNISQNLTKSTYSVYHNRPKSHYRKNTVIIKSDEKKNTIIPASNNEPLSDKFKSHKFLKPLDGERIISDHATTTTTYEKALTKESPFILPESNLRKSSPLETNTIHVVEGSLDSHRKYPETTNDSFGHNENGSLEESFQCNPDSGAYIQVIQNNKLQAGEREEIDSPTIISKANETVDSNMQSIELGAIIQTQKPTTQESALTRHHQQVESPERIIKTREFKIQNLSLSPNKRRLRPPTSPSHLSSQPNKVKISSSATRTKISNTPEVRGSSSFNPNNSVAEALISSVNSRTRRLNQNYLSSSPLKIKKDSQFIDKGKIAEIKQRVLNKEWVHTRLLGKTKPTTQEQGQIDADDNSIADENMFYHLNESDHDEEEDELDDSCPTNRSGTKKQLLLESVYAGRPPTVFFTYPPCCELTRDSSRTYPVPADDEKAYDLRYKAPTISCVSRTFETSGFKKTEGPSWNVLWGMPKYDRIKEMNKYQKTNHFPGCWEVGRKDGLWRNLSKMKRQFPLDYAFVPTTYILNTDFERFIQIKEAAENKAIWIMKPCASACGRGIKLINKKTKLTKKPGYLVSEYVANPHLINGHKYDLRVYVLVSSFDPLRVYLFKEGLVRFATAKYNTTKKNLNQRFAHLTNWSVNKHSENFIKNEKAEKDGEGSKWSFTALRKYFIENGIDYDGIFGKIKDIIIKTLISAEPLMLNSLNRSPEHKNNCFELYGYDILLDSNLKPWLMEVNVCPSLNSSSPIDRKIKTTLLCDIMNLVGVQPYNKKKYEEECKKRLLGLSLETRKYVAKNYYEILDLDETNCLEKLSADDWNILFDTDEEWYRKGTFERIFPLRENVDTYSKYFEYQRYNNLIVWQWLKAKTNFLEKISSKIHNVPV